MKRQLLTAALALMAGSALAQNWATDSKRGALEHSANIISTTTLKPVAIEDVRSQVKVSLWANGSEAVNVLWLDSAGRTLLTESLTASTTTVVSTSQIAPLPYAAVQISPTGLTGTDAVSASVQQLPVSGYDR